MTIYFVTIPTLTEEQRKAAKPPDGGSRPICGLT